MNWLANRQAAWINHGRSFTRRHFTCSIATLTLIALPNARGGGFTSWQVPSGNWDVPANWNNGIYDMQGNIQEHAQDWWSEHEYRRYLNATAIDPTGPANDSESGGFRVACGGHYKDTPRAHDRMIRQRQSSSIAGNWSGFRLVIPARAVTAEQLALGK